MKRKWRLEGEGIIKPKKYRNIPTYRVKYKYAEDFVKKTPLPNSNERVFALLSGRFIFGDLIEAYFVKNNLFTDNLQISTLSLSQDNIDSLSNLINGRYVGNIDLIVSDFFYAHERHKNGLIKYLYDAIDNSKLQLTVIGSHCKITQFKIDNNHYVIHGSANLRSSDNIEQIMIENNIDLFEFNDGWMNRAKKDYSTIKKSKRGVKLWQIVGKAEKVGKVQVKQKQAKDRLNEAN